MSIEFLLAGRAIEIDSSQRIRPSFANVDITLFVIWGGVLCMSRKLLILALQRLSQLTV